MYVRMTEPKVEIRGRCDASYEHGQEFIFLLDEKDAIDCYSSVSVRDIIL